jgi:phage gpG-like protein
MANEKINEAPNFLAMAKTLKADAKRYAEVHCIQWFQESFQNEGFTDNSLVKWEKRKQPDKATNNILTNTTYLRKSLEDILSETPNSITFGTTVPYASLHNEGGRMRVVQYVRAHSRTRKGKREQVQSHSRKMDVKFPKRQFIGHSEKMMNGLDSWLCTEIEKRFDQLK